MMDEGPSMDIFTASSLGYLDIVEELVQRGQSIDQQNKGGFTALMYACTYHKNEIVLHLLSRGAKITLMDPDQNTFISLAAEHNNLKALTFLNEGWPPSNLGRNQAMNHYQMAASLTINLYQLKHGLTPLMTAASQGLHDVVGLLLKLGADKTLRDSKGQTAHDLAILHGHRAAAVKIDMHGEINITVESILARAGLEKYETIFSQMPLDKFLTLEEQDLKNMGIKLLGPRKTLLMAIGKL